MTQPDSNYRARNEALVDINYDNPEIKAPPITEVGTIAWIRQNLFSSPLDVLLTLVGFAIIAFVVVTFVQWSIQVADWEAININFQRFMVDRLDDRFLPRIQFFMMFLFFTIGATIAAYTRRVSAVTGIVLGAVLLFLVGLPYAINAFVPLPDTLLAASQENVEFGTSSEDPPERLAFVAAAGTEIVVSLPEINDEATLRNLDGYMDRAVNTVRNAAIQRQVDIERFRELTTIIIEDTTLLADVEGGSEEGLGVLTDRQRDNVYREYEGYISRSPEERQETLTNIFEDISSVSFIDSTTPRRRLDLTDNAVDTFTLDPVYDRFNVNVTPVSIAILDAEGNMLGDVSRVITGGEPVTVATIPEDGWYIIEKQAENPNSIQVIAVNGVQPIFVRGSGYYSLPEDTFFVTERPPRIDGDDISITRLIEYSYFGDRNLQDYLRVSLAPFLLKLVPGIVILSLSLLAGFFSARLTDRTQSPAESPRRFSRRLSTWLLVLVPILLILMTAGFELDFFGNELTLLEPSNPRTWGGLLLSAIITVFGIIAAFPIGIVLALGRRSTLPAISNISTLIIETVRGTPFIVVLFAGQLLVPVVFPFLGDVPNVYRALASTIIFSAAYLAENVRGGLQSIPPGQAEAARALGMNNFQIVTSITLPQALRAVIPALVGQFISLFKDTSLLAIVGLIDLTGVVNTMVAQSEFNDARREGLLFISIIYFVISYIMSYISRRIEESGSGAARRI